MRASPNIDESRFISKAEFMKRLKKHHELRSKRLQRLNYLNKNIAHSYYQRHYKLPGDMVSPFLEIDTRIPFSPKNVGVKSRYLDQIGHQKKTFNMLSAMDDYQTLKVRSEMDKVRRKNGEQLSQIRNQSS